MSSWEEIQAVKVKRNSLREKLEKRKKERQDLLGSNSSSGSGAVVGVIKIESSNSLTEDKDIDAEVEKYLVQVLADQSLILPTNSAQIAERVEKHVQKTIMRDSVAYYLHKLAGQKLINIKEVSIGGSVGYEVISAEHINLQALYDEMAMNHVPVVPVNATKRKAECTIEDKTGGGGKAARANVTSIKDEGRKGNAVDASLSCQASDIMSLLSLPSTREKQSKKVGEEILELLSKPTAKERSLAEKFKSQGGAQVMEFCPHGTRIECMRSSEAAPETREGNDKKASININNEEKSECKNEYDVIIAKDDEPCQADSSVANEMKHEVISSNTATSEAITEIQVKKTKYQCNKLHFKKIIQTHTDETLGDCSFLNTCFHMDTCKYVHYEVDTYVGQTQNTIPAKLEPADERVAGQKRHTTDACATLYPPQWIQCDLRFLDMTVLGKFAVVMADPPWDIHMELPYGTMSDDEMRQLGVPALQDDGLIFLWVTGRAMELGRECLKLWGYERVDELIWVKTNQLQRIIRTGRTGHWLNHGKEHCLVGMKGNPPNLNRGLDCDVIVAEVRATSHKPDEIYGIIERLSPGTRKIELFGRPHNVQPNWITLGNQLDGIRLVDPELINSFQKRYPDGNCMTPGKNP
ncbi:N6-adenosine-methyltransferase MT-A70-like protein isoform X2 [Anopheles maculipalpis]|uniref:N6-adenosine-methyltransferase MT-A70-like protein isoform X2 n=1 Tax=Anopheles maculipalpis TaxID=1496333 RepID=UPI00215952BE|nr:N6-adenosine-methyltransferase MT-A70-like protein isoform X2 [Anopheles maculipalpis]